MAALGVVELDEDGDDAPGLGNVLEVVQPCAFLFERADEALAQAVLFGGVGSG